MSGKTSTIVIIDDQLAGMDKHSVVVSIMNIAKAVGYTDAQQAQIKESLRFFEQYNEKDGPPLKGTRGYAADYLKELAGGTEMPVLVCVDNQFYPQRPGLYPEHGDEILRDIEKLPPRPGGLRPAVLWVSNDPAPKGVVPVNKFQLNDNFVDETPGFILKLAKCKPPEGEKPFESVTAVQTLRDAFEFIAGPPQNKYWKNTVSALPASSGGIDACGR